MGKPLTGPQAIEIRRQWRKEQWAKKYPTGECRVVRQTRKRWDSSAHKYYGSYDYVILVQIVSTDFNGYDKVGEWFDFPCSLRSSNGGPKDRPYYSRIGSNRHSEYKFTDRAKAVAKFDKIKQEILNVL